MHALILAAVVLTAGAGKPAELPRTTLVAVAPGYPGTTAEAQPHMDAFAAALAGEAGWPSDRLAAVYQSTEKDGLARLAEPDAAVALVSLPFLLKHGDALKLTPRMQVAMQGGGLTEQWTLVAKKGRIRSPADLAGFSVNSIAGYAPEFVRGALGEWGRIPDSANVVESGQVLSALRKAASGADVALLLDGAQTTALSTLPFADQLEVLARSAPLPTGLVTTVDKRLPAARWSALEKAFAKLDSDPQGKAVLESIRMNRFVPVDAAALAAARRTVAGPAR